MSTTQYLQEAQFLHNVFVLGATIGIGLLILFVVELIRRK